MAPIKLNNAQVDVLRWVLEGSPANVMEGYSHRLSAAALRSRGLIRISGRGRTWQAQITPAGESHLAEISEGPCEVEEASANPKKVTESPADPKVGESPGHAVPEAPRPIVSSRPSQAEILKFVLPTDLRGAHPLVIATREAASGLRAERDGRFEVGPKEGVAYLVLSRPVLRRALLVLHCLTRESIKRGWEVISYSAIGRESRPGIAIEIRGHCYPVEVHELTETLPFTEAEIEAWRTEWKWDLERRAGQIPPPQHKRKQATGRLRLQLPNGYGGGRASWSEGPRGPIEAKFSSVFKTLEERAYADEQMAIEHARIREERRVEKEAQEVRARRMRIENARVQRLLAEIDAWRRSNEIRLYVDELEQKLHNLDGHEYTRIAEWCNWAKHWADRSDPTYQTSLITGFNDDRDESHYPRR